MEVSWEELEEEEGLEEDGSGVEMFPNMMQRSLFQLEPFWPFLMVAAGDATSEPKQTFH